jgi:tetratricopeptide (TPR) repeat protein
VNQRARDLGHAPSMAHPLLWTSRLETLRGDAAAALSAAEELEALCRAHGMPFWRVRAELNAGWARGRLHDAAAGAEDLRRALAAAGDQGMMGDAWFYTALLAEFEAQTLGADSALARNDEALALARQVDNRCDLPFPHIMRGELLLKRDPSDPAPAEEAFRTALAIGREQGARSWGLRAALALAKLYQSTARTTEAYAALAPALEGFIPTPEMPEIAEAQALLAALAEADEVKAAIARRERRLQLHVSYGNALMAVRGYGASETAEAFARAHESAAGEMHARDRPAAAYGLWLGSYVRGELSSMRTHADAFLSDVGARPDSPEAGVAHRIRGVTHQFAGEFVEAREQFDRALALFQPGRDDDLAFRFVLDPGVAALICSAIASWPLGEIRRAISHNERAQGRLAGITHVGTLAFGRHHSAMFALMRHDRISGAQHASELARLARDHDLMMFHAFSVFLNGWATAKQAPEAGLLDMRRGVQLLREQKVLQFDGLLKIEMAVAEAEAGDLLRAVEVLEEAIETCERTGYRAFHVEVSRIRGDILLRRDPADPAAAEEAYRTAIAIAKQQGARSYELLASRSLAKLYQSAGRPTEAHAVLAPALDGFAPTPEMPEIAEALETIAAIEAGPHL